VVDSADAEAAAAFATAVTTVIEAVREGTLFPRVEEPDGSEPRFCSFCPVRQACLRDDSGFRRRVATWMAGRDRRRARWVKAARALWWLGVERPGEAR
jgi:hypothetical protein